MSRFHCPDPGTFVQNPDCPCFPCHKGIDAASFSCLFCYCPLYALGRDCGGNFKLTVDGIKDCSDCIVPHHVENYGRITARSIQLIEKVRKEMADGTDKEAL